MVSCQGCGEETTSRLCCPKCNELGRRSFFCSQDCFVWNWASHNKLHSVIKSSKITLKDESISVNGSECFVNQNDNVLNFSDTNKSSFLPVVSISSSFSTGLSGNNGNLNNRSSNEYNGFQNASCKDDNSDDDNENDDNDNIKNEKKTRMNNFVKGRIRNLLGQYCGQNGSYKCNNNGTGGGGKFSLYSLIKELFSSKKLCGVVHKDNKSYNILPPCSLTTHVKATSRRCTALLCLIVLFVVFMYFSSFLLYYFTSNVYNTTNKTKSNNSLVTTSSLDSTPSASSATASSATPTSTSTLQLLEEIRKEVYLLKNTVIQHSETIKELMNEKDPTFFRQAHTKGRNSFNNQKAGSLSTDLSIPLFDFNALQQKNREVAASSFFIEKYKTKENNGDTNFTNNNFNVNNIKDSSVAFSNAVLHSDRADITNTTVSQISDRAIMEKESSNLLLNKISDTKAAKNFLARHKTKESNKKNNILLDSSTNTIDNKTSFMALGIQENEKRSIGSDDLKDSVTQESFVMKNGVNLNFTNVAEDGHSVYDDLKIGNAFQETKKSDLQQESEGANHYLQTAEEESLARFSGKKQNRPLRAAKVENHPVIATKINDQFIRSAEKEDNSSKENDQLVDSAEREDQSVDAAERGDQSVDAAERRDQSVHAARGDNSVDAAKEGDHSIDVSGGQFIPVLEEEKNVHTVVERNFQKLAGVEKLANVVKEGNYTQTAQEGFEKGADKSVLLKGDSNYNDIKRRTE